MKDKEPSSLKGPLIMNCINISHNKSYHGNVTSTNMVFTLLYLFKAKPGQLPYVDNDCEDSVDKGARIIETSQS
jgi:hypothetical protein